MKELTYFMTTGYACCGCGVVIDGNQTGGVRLCGACVQKQRRVKPVELTPGQLSLFT